MAFFAAVADSSSPGTRITCSTPSHTLKPGRRRSAGLRNGLETTPTLFLFILLLTFLGHAQAFVAGEPVGVDRLRAILGPRQDPLSNGGGTSQTATKTTKTSSKSSSATKATTTDSVGSKASSTGSSQPQLTGVPKVFDLNVGNNFTQQACPEFLQGLSSNDNFNNCLPLSLLVVSSRCSARRGFQLTSSRPLRSLSSIVGRLAHSRKYSTTRANVVLPTCNNLMQNLAVKLISPEVCADDYAKENPLVLQAYNGFLAYKPLYQAGCLKVSDKDVASASSLGAKPTKGLHEGNINPDAGPQYCYVATTANNSAPVNAYIYTLPLGTPLPSGAGDVNCTDCLRQTMNFFAQAATNASNPVSKLYPAAAQEINAKCGKNWVKSSVEVDASTVPNGASGLQASAAFALVTAALVLFGL